MDIAKEFRQLFGTAQGQVVLDEICLRGKLFDKIETIEEMAVENFVKEILQLALTEDSGTIRKSVFMELIKRISKRRRA